MGYREMGLIGYERYVRHVSIARHPRLQSTPCETEARPNLPHRSGSSLSDASGSARRSRRICPLPGRTTTPRSVRAEADDPRDAAG